MLSQRPALARGTEPAAKTPRVGLGGGGEMRLRAAAAAVGIVATIAMAGPAAAQPICAGEADVFFVCVDPSGSSRTVCVYAGPPPCIPVTIPIPTAWCGGNMTSICSR